MKCPECQIELPEGSQFCGQCGAKLEMVCPNCQAPNPPQFKFCLKCGHNLTSPAKTLSSEDLSFDEKLAKIQKYLPGGLTEKILSQRDRIEGERRHVTIMFVDLKGFTPLAEKLGPEETFGLMDQVFEILIHKIHDYEGTVNELRGDGVLALFGAPIVLEDAPQRAIRATLAMHREMTKFSEKIKAEKDIPPLLLRIGVNSGPVVVGTIGNDLRVQFTAVGDTINMAARMEQLAEPGTTYVTEDTFKLTEGFFRFECLGEKEIKGKGKGLTVYRVIAPSTRRTRFDVSAERGLTRFIGRERELDLLLEAFDKAKEGRSQAVSIMGEAGAGKSRLLYEFRKAVANEEVTFFEGKCLSYGRGVAYHPIIDVLKSSFGIEEGESDSVITEKVKKGLSLLGTDEQSTLPYLLELLSVKKSGIDKISMSPEAKKARIIGALRRIILKGAERKPVIYAFEDLHWMDKSSEEATKLLMESIPGSRVLMIFTYRPEFVHTWGGKSYHSQLHINRLSDRESLAMLADLLDSDNIAPDLQDLVLDRTEGIPFFIEEFVRSLRNLGIIERTDYAYHLPRDMARVDIPSTIHDVIMTPVNWLPDAAKEVLESGSAIGREFSYNLIKAVTELSEPNLVSYLSALMYAELIYERGIFPESTYIFRHAITSEVVYGSIPASRKKLLHHKVGKGIEYLCRDNLASYYSILADHFMIGEDFQKSADYSRLTYERARKQAAFPSAISYAQKRIAALEQLPSTPEVEAQLIDARTWQGLTLFTTGHLEEAKEAIDPIVETTLKGNDKVRLTQVYFILGAYEYSVEENVEKGLELLKKAVQNANKTTDVRSASLAHFYYGEALCLNCQFDRGAENIGKAISILEAVQNLWAVSTLYSHLSCYAYNYQGKVQEAFTTSLKAMDIAERSGDIHSRAHAYVCYGISCFYKGIFAEAEEHLLKGIELYDRHPVPAIGHQFLGHLYFENGDYEKSQAHYRKAILFRERSGVLPSCVKLNKMALACAVLAAGQAGLDIPSLEQVLRSNKSKLYSGIIARHFAYILFHLGEPHFVEAESWLHKAILNHEQQGMKWDLASDYMVMAQLLKLQGREAEEMNCLDKSLLLFNQCGADGWVTRAEEELAKLS